MSAVSKWARKDYETRRIPEYISMAFRHTLSPTPAPVYLEIGRDTLLAEVEEEDVWYSHAYRSETPPFGNPGRCAFEVSKFLNDQGKDWTVVMDGGDAALWIRAAVTARRPGQLLTMD